MVAWLYLPETAPCIVTKMLSFSRTQSKHVSAGILDTRQ